MKLPFSKNFSPRTSPPEKIKNITIITNKFERIICIKAMSNEKNWGI